MKKVNKDEIIKIAERFIVSQLGRQLEFIDAKPSTIKSEFWNVSFKTKDLEGINYDGPTLIQVNIFKKVAQFFE